MVKFYRTLFIASSVTLLLSACGGGATQNPLQEEVATDNKLITITGGGQKSEEPVSEKKCVIMDENIVKYAEEKEPSTYKLEQIDDTDFNALSTQEQYQVADKLLSSLFYGFPYAKLKERVTSGTFISDIRAQLLTSRNDMSAIEEEIHNTQHYKINDRTPQNIILARFATMPALDKNYMNHWIAYILTQTILFSPATELSTVAEPDIYGVYNRLYYNLDKGTSMRYISFENMISYENWRRFRSPEDNGREMLEIYALDRNDSSVPIAAQALQNWHLSKYSNTLVVAQNRNTKPLTLFHDMHFTNGLEFYAALVNSKEFTVGVTTRLVDFMFTDTPESKKAVIIQKIVASEPKTWSDILKQILFSKEYLLHTARAKSIEEVVFPLMKELYYNPYYYTFDTLANKMNDMGQSPMKYKLGKLTRVPLDDNSFAFYQSYIRNTIFRTHSIDTPLSYNPKLTDEDKNNSIYIMSNYKDFHRQGASSKKFLAEENFAIVQDDVNATNTNYINYLFHTVLHRSADAEELKMFRDYLKSSYYENGLLSINSDKDYQTYMRYQYKFVFNSLVFEYISRLDALYFFQEIK